MTMVHAVWCMKSASGWQIDPRMCIRRDARSITKIVSVGDQAAQGPDLVVKKSAPAMAPRARAGASARRSGAAARVGGSGP